MLLLGDLQDVKRGGGAAEDSVCCVRHGLQVVLECECVSGPCGDDGDGCLCGCVAEHESVDDFVDCAVTTDDCDAVEVLQF